MKYMTVPQFQLVSDALNFDNDGCVVQGGCDLFTTKAPVSDKKLMAKIDAELQAKYKDLLSIAVSLSPPEATLFARNENLSRSSPFGALSESANRRAFAYLIATLNACWRDYDLSNTLTPDDFRAIKLYDAQARIEEKIYGAHSRACLVHIAKNGGNYSPGGSAMWRPNMWDIISEEMTLSDCAVYTLNAKENPFDEGPELWSMHYFFYNKGAKRVCYLYARATDVSIYELTHEPTTPTPRIERRRPASEYDFESEGFGANKRASYWLGKRADDVEGYAGGSDVIRAPGDDEVDREVDPYALSESIRNGRSMTPISISSDSDEDVRAFASRTKTPSKPPKTRLEPSSSETDHPSPSKKKKTVRSLSASIMEAMEM